MTQNRFQYRHEWKYLCLQTEWALIQSRIAPLMALDPHARQRGHYTIRSLYFDDMENACFFENEDGVDERAKFRIRVYDQKTEDIRLELKEKSHGVTLKRSCPLTQAQCRQLMKGIPFQGSPDVPELLKRLSLRMATRLMRPKVIVEYDRIPYVYPLGNVRVTFDQNIRSGDDVAGFLDGAAAKRPIMPPGQHILEVKYDRFLPDVIRRQVQFDKMQAATFSKYYLCMKYNLGGWTR